MKCLTSMTQKFEEYLGFKLSPCTKMKHIPLQVSPNEAKQPHDIAQAHFYGRKAMVSKMKGWKLKKMN